MNYNESTHDENIIYYYEYYIYIMIFIYYIMCFLYKYVTSYICNIYIIYAYIIINIIYKI